MARKLKLSLNQLLKKQFNPEKSQALENIAYSDSRRRLETAQKELLKELDSHEVTQSLEKKTRTSLLGHDANLFEFLGFHESENPVSVVRDAFKNYIKIRKTPSKKKISATRITYNFSVTHPSLNELYQVTPLPWGGGRSWIRAVEKGGVSNFNYTLRTTTSQNSRSGTAIQSRNEVRSFNYKPVPYLSNMLNKFRLKLKK